MWLVVGRQGDLVDYHDIEWFEFGLWYQIKFIRFLYSARGTEIWNPRPEFGSTVWFYFGSRSGQFIINPQRGCIMIFAWTNKFFYAAHLPEISGFEDNTTHRSVDPIIHKAFVSDFILNGPNAMGLNSDNIALNEPFPLEPRSVYIRGSQCHVYSSEYNQRKSISKHSLSEKSCLRAKDWRALEKIGGRPAR